MTVIKINAITVPADSGDELAQRFAARAGAVDGQAGFEGFELLKPADADRHTWLVVTRWADEESFQAWVSSAAFGHGHRSESATEGRPAPSHVGLSSELWSYEIAGGSQG
jgi:heme-degrading monooxygenase HmoA